MTKEKILYNCLPETLPPNTTSISEVLTPKILLAMEEYAKQQALDFTDWIFSSDIIKSNHPIDAGKYFYNKSGELAANNTEELYSLFLKETAK